MKVQSAKDYGSRKVVRVIVDETIPQWVHPDGTPAPDTHTGDTVDPDRTKTLCTDCRLNWDIREHLFEDDADTKLSDPDDDQSPRIAKTDQEILDEATAKASASVAAPRVMAAQA